MFIRDVKHFGECFCTAHTHIQSTKYFCKSDVSLYRIILISTISDLASFDSWINSLTRLFPCRDLNHGPPAPQADALPIELSWLDLFLKSLIFDIVTQIPWCSNIKSPFCKIHCFDIQTKHEWLNPVSRLYLLGKLFKF